MYKKREYTIDKIAFYLVLFIGVGKHLMNLIR